MVKVNISQLLTAEDLQFVINLHLLFSFIHWDSNSESGPDIDIKFLHGDKENCQT